MKKEKCALVAKLSYAGIHAIDIHEELGKGTFKNYVDRKRWVGGQSNVYANKMNDHFLFT